MRVTAISDLHGFLPDIEGTGDLLLIGGDLVPDDFSGTDYVSHKDQARWMKGIFKSWLEDMATKFTHIVGIAGNHDIIVMQNQWLARNLPWHYLDDETVELDGFKVFGSPWVPTFGSWAFMKPDVHLLDSWDKIPEDVDILLTHGPSYGYGDLTSPKWGAEHVGSQTLANKLLFFEYPNLQLHVFGHIHPAYGVTEVDGMIHANASHVNESYEPVNKPHRFEINK